MTQSNQTLKLWLALGCWSLAIALIIDTAGWNLNGVSTQPRSRITRSQLAHLLTVRAPSPIAPIQQTLGEPYCILAGAGETQQIYPAEWNPSTWIVVRQQDNAYQGYDFILNQPGDWFD